MKNEKWAFRLEGKKLNCIYTPLQATAEKCIRRLLERSTPAVGFDIETAKHPRFKSDPQAGLCPYRSAISLLQFYDGIDTIYIFDALQLPLEMFREVFYTKRLVAHNAIFDVQHLRHAGFPDVTADCTMILYNLVRGAEFATMEEEEQSIDENWQGEEGDGNALDWLAKYERYGASLRAVVAKLLGIRIEKELQVSNWANRPLSREQLSYAAKDSYLTYEVGKILSRKIIEYKMQKVYKLNREAIHPVCDMILNGWKIDTKAHQKDCIQWQKDKDRLHVQVIKLFGNATNIQSTVQISKWLEKHLPRDAQHGWPRSEKTGRLRSDAKTLSSYAHLSFVQPLLEYKKLEKMLSTYGLSLLEKVNPVTKRLHGSYTLGYTATGRLSSRNPNMQNLPRGYDIRKIFIPEEGNVIVSADYGQIEMRVAAILSRDKTMLSAYKNGVDLHEYIVSRITGKPLSRVTKSERQMGKACFSGDTEILTKSGWVRLDSYNGQAQVAQYVIPPGVETNPRRRCASRFNDATLNLPFNGVGGEIQFVMPFNYQAVKGRPCLATQDRNTDIFATEDHEILFLTRNNHLHKKPFNEVTGNVRHIIAAGFLRTTPKATEDFTRVLAMVVADGSFVERAEGHEVRFGFSKRRKLKRCRALLERMGLEVTQRKSKQDRVYEVYIRDRELVGRLLSYVDTNKRLGWNTITGLDCRAYLEEASFWDGHEPGTGRERVLFCTSVEETCDVMQAMCVLNGIPSVKYHRPVQSEKGKHSDIWVLSYALKSLPLHRVSWNPTPAGVHDTYCVQVPSGNIVIRRNGKVSIQGNCNFGLIFGLGAPGLMNYAKWNYGVDLTLDEAYDMVRGYFDTYRGVARWHKVQRARCEKTLHVSTKLGKLRRLTENGMYTRSVNHPVQGSAAEVVIQALNNQYGTGDATLLACVHDEINLECPQDKVEEVTGELRENMEQAMLKIFPKATLRDLVGIGSGPSWGAAKS